MGKMFRWDSLRIFLRRGNRDVISLRLDLASLWRLRIRMRLLELDFQVVKFVVDESVSLMCSVNCF